MSTTKRIFLMGFMMLLFSVASATPTTEFTLIALDGDAQGSETFFEDFESDFDMRVNSEDLSDVPVTPSNVISVSTLVDSDGNTIGHVIKFGLGDDLPYNRWDNAEDGVILIEYNYEEGIFKGCAYVSNLPDWIQMIGN